MERSRRLMSAAAPDARAVVFQHAFDLVQAQSFGQLHLPPLSQEQFIRPHAEHFIRTSFKAVEQY
jgi:hypothetical protein